MEKYLFVFELISPSKFIEDEMDEEINGCA